MFPFIFETNLIREYKITITQIIVNVCNYYVYNYQKTNCKFVEIVEL